MLYPHQVSGWRFLNTGRRRYNADEMGLGKTIQALVAAKERGAKKVLTIGPAASLGNWHRENGVWGDPRWTFKAVSYAGYEVHAGKVSGGPWDVVICDEAHYMTNRLAKRTKGALKIAADAGAASLLSGTPGRNASALWPVFNALWPELVPEEARGYDAWVRYFCTYVNVRFSHWGQPKQKITGHRPEHLEELKAMMAKVMLRRRLSEVGLDLPPLRVTLHSIPEGTVYMPATGTSPVLQALLDEEAKDERSLSRIRHLLGQLKAPVIADILHTELEERQYDKIVVGYYHTDVGDVLANTLRPFGVVRLSGATPARERQTVIDRFNQDANVRVFLGQQTAAREALNLQAASEIVLVEPDWVPDPNRQFIKRVHRIGQDSPCRARVFGVQGTLDEQVMQNIARHTQHQEELGLR
jgi:SWI/SNF-related matrix-associated actin-dependent regulator 1 of chromatin subfamily A